jgi:hypothetical protein
VITDRGHPQRVLAREPQDELTDLYGGRRPTGAPVRIRPTARDEFAVPTQQRRGLHEQRRLPAPPRQHAAECRQQRPISLRQLRTSDQALQHLQLVAEQQNLDLLLPLGATAKYEQLEEPTQRPVEQRDRNALAPTRHDR